MKLQLTVDANWEEDLRSEYAEHLNIMEYTGLIFTEDDGVWPWKVRRSRTDPYEYVAYSERARSIEEAREQCLKVMLRELVSHVSRIDIIEEGN